MRKLVQPASTETESLSRPRQTLHIYIYFTVRLMAQISFRAGAKSVRVKRTGVETEKKLNSESRSLHEDYEIACNTYFIPFTSCSSHAIRALIDDIRIA